MARQGSDQENWDQRASPVTQDPNSMTIDFLRARLLAERAVSKSAREKADELAKRVAELEEQLKIVSLQRKKAEKATADVLAILEENGFTDGSETFDSSSDLESFFDTNMVKSSIKVEESSENPKVRNNEMEELSASEHASFPVPCKNISWRGRRGEPSSSNKFKESCTRRQRSFESVYFSSPRPRQGKSCRQIRRRESRSVVEDHKRDGNMVDQESEVNNSEILTETTEERPHSVRMSADIKGEEDLQKVANSNCSENQNNMDIKMERALECQAQLIGRFKDMERAQREWEEKFRESNISTMDLYDPGNYSDVTDESNETRSLAEHQGSTVVSFVHGARSTTNAVDHMESFAAHLHVSPDNSAQSQDNLFQSCVYKSVDQDVSLTGGTGKYIQGRPESEWSRPQSRGSDSCCQSLSTNLSALILQPNSGSSSHCTGATVIQKEAYPLVPVAQENSSGCNTVLVALKEARLSLQVKVNSLHLPNVGCVLEGSCPSMPTSRINKCALPTEPAFDTKLSICVSKVGQISVLPMGCTGLFRVPSDLSSDVSKRNNLQALASQRPLASHLPEAEIPQSSGDNLFSKISTKNLLSSGFQSNVPDSSTLMTGDRPLTTPYIGGSKLWSSFRTEDPLINGSQRFTPYTSGPRVLDSPISYATSACIGNRASPTSFCLDRQPSFYNWSPSFHLPSTSSLPSSPCPVQHGMERFSTSFKTYSVGLPPIDSLSDDNFKRNKQ